MDNSTRLKRLAKLGHLSFVNQRELAELQLKKQKEKDEKEVMLQKLLDEQFQQQKLRRIQEIKRKYNDELMHGVNQWVDKTKVRQKVLERNQENRNEKAAFYKENAIKVEKEKVKWLDTDEIEKI